MRVLNPTFLAMALALLAAGCKQDSATEQAAAGAAKAELDAEGFPAGPYADRDPALAKQLVEAGAVVLDVRTPGEYEGGHLEGAVNIDHREVEARMAEIRALAGDDLHKPVVLYCRSGRRADLVKAQLEAAGFDRVTNLGGIKDYPG